MENIEDKLKSYRLYKRRQEKINQVKHNIKRFFMFGSKEEKEQSDKTILIIHDSETEELTKPLSIFNEADEGISDVLPSQKENTSDVGVCNENLFLQYILAFVYLAFWITLYVIAIELQFGIVFLMFSALAGIYLNTRTGPKKENEISAYSVFNKKCESIDGTLKAEQFEREFGIR